MAPIQESVDRPQPGLVLGFDIGDCKSVVAMGTAGTPVGKADLVMNEMSNRATPTLVSFHGTERSVGEKAQGQLGVNPQNTVTHLLRWLGKDAKDVQASADPHLRFSVVAGDSGAAAAKVSYNSEELHLLPEQLLGMLLAQLTRHACGGSAQPEVKPVVSKAAISVPSIYSARQRACVLAAAKIAGLPEDAVSIVSDSDAAISCYNVQHLTSSKDTSPRHIMLLNIGSAFTSVSIYRVAPDGKPAKLSNSASDSIGGYALDRLVFNEFQAQCAAKGVAVEAGTRAGYRMMVECEKVKRTLSTIPETFTVLECVGENDTDVKLTLTRAKFEELSSDLRSGLEALVRGAVQGAGLALEDVSTVELAGGSSRVPWVRSSVAEVFGGNESILSTRLDSSSCFALGAAFMAEAAALEPMLEDGFKNPTAVEKMREGILRVVELPESEGIGVTFSPDVIEAAVQLEAKMQRQDEEEAAKAEARNRLESYILQMRSAVMEGKHDGALKEDLVGPLLEAAEDWMYGDGEDSGLQAHQDYLKQLQDKVHAACPAWFEAEEAERKRIEDELTAQHQAAMKEAEGQEKEDHDFRKLPKPERMRLVNLNKEEANELYKGGNVAPAVQRWQKALQHSGKFFDLSEDDKKEVNAVTLSLHLNLAMGYLKLAELESEKAANSVVSKDAMEQFLKKAKESCTEALAIDDKCAKALFRRATAMEKLKYFDEAFKDCKAALELEPDDKMIIRLYDRVKKVRAARLEKEKNFAKRMFG